MLGVRVSLCGWINRRGFRLDVMMRSRKRWRSSTPTPTVALLIFGNVMGEGERTHTHTRTHPTVVSLYHQAAQAA